VREGWGFICKKSEDIKAEDIFGGRLKPSDLIFQLGTWGMAPIEGPQSQQKRAKWGHGKGMGKIPPFYREISRGLVKNSCISFPRSIFIV